MAELSNTLFYAALGTYLAAMVAYFFRMAFTRATVEGAMMSMRAGERARLAATGLAIGGAAAHLGSVLARGVAAGRAPWANMYEYSSVVALIAVGGGLVVLQRRMGFGDLMGFVLAASVVMMSAGAMLFVPAGPTVPALESYWLQIHVTAMVGASAVFLLAFVMTVLYLARDAAEGRVMSPVWFAALTAAFFFASGALRYDVARGGAMALVGALIGVGAWYALPHLPSAAHLDVLAYRIVAFAMPIFTFAIICGAVWAEEAWGRYWGWDPKETGSFFTWVLYAAYLHARATHGWRGRRAAWIGVGAFVALMVTYFAVNLVVVGLHSYAR
jgi:cytochrome c-type biogenesis protein CcsB